MSSCQFQLDSIASQNGWSTMTNDYAQPDSFTSGGAGNSIVNVSFNPSSNGSDMCMFV